MGTSSFLNNHTRKMKMVSLLVILGVVLDIFNVNKAQGSAPADNQSSDEIKIVTLYRTSGLGGYGYEIINGDYFYMNTPTAPNYVYKVDGVAFNVYTSAGDGMMALYQCSPDARWIHSISTDSKCEGGDFMSLLGYVYAEPTVDHLPIYRFDNGQKRLATLNIKEGAGLNENGILGYAPRSTDIHVISLKNLPKGLKQLSKVLHDKPTDPAAWTKAKLMSSLAEDLSRKDIESQGSNNLLLIAVNSLLPQLKIQIVDEQFIPKLSAVMKANGLDSIDNVELDGNTLNMAIAIVEKTLQTIRAYQTDVRSSEKIQKIIVLLAQEVSSQDRYSRKLTSFIDFAEKLSRSDVLTAALDNPRTNPEATMLNLVLGWIVKK